MRSRNVQGVEHPVLWGFRVALVWLQSVCRPAPCQLCVAHCLQLLKLLGDSAAGTAQELASTGWVVHRVDRQA